MIKKSDTDNFASGLFYLREDPVSGSFNHSNELILTLGDCHEIKEWILNAIESAQKYLKICSFILTDKDVLNALLQRVKKNELSVFILTQLDSSKFSTSFITDEEMEENPEGTHLKWLSRLYEAGVHVRASETVHAKFIIVDGERSLVTSANLTTPSLTLNPESGIELIGKKSQTVEHLFDVIYQYGTTYHRFISAGKNRQFIVRNEAILPTKWLPHDDKAIFYTYGTEVRKLYQKLIEAVASSKDDIIIATYSCVNLEFLPGLIQEIKNAVKRGISVKIFCRGMNYREDHLRGCNLLADLGCEVRGDLLNHSKGISTHDFTMLFTANIDGNHGLLNGFELGSAVEGESRKEFDRFLDWQFQNAPLLFKKNGSRREFFDTYDSYCDQKRITPPKEFVHLCVRITPDGEKAAKEVANFPFYLVYKDDKLEAIMVNNSTYRARHEENQIKVGALTKSSFRKARYLARYQTLEIIED